MKQHLGENNTSIIQNIATDTSHIMGPLYKIATIGKIIIIMGLNSYIATHYLDILRRRII